MFTMHNFVNAKVGKGEPLLGEVNSINLQKVNQVHRRSKELNSTENGDLKN